MANTIIVPGQRLVSQEGIDDSLTNYKLKSETVAAVGVSETVRGERREVVVEDAEDDDVVEIEYANGVREWMQVARLRELQPPATRGAIDESVFRVDVRMGASATRGGAGVLALTSIKLLKISVDPVGELAELAAGASADLLVPPVVAKAVPYFERQYRPDSGLYRFVDEGKALELVTAPLSGSAQAHLVLIHGTFSRLENSFHGLRDSSDWKSLCSRYDDRLLGLNHFTLSESPVDNALTLAKLLPDGAQLHLLTHSRGGLVGELLSLKEVPEAALRVFDILERETDLSKLRSLLALLEEKQFSIDRFVRVASPTRGTLLMSDRLDRYLSLVLNLIGKIPAMNDTLIYPFAKATILTLIQQRAQAHVLPGLEAMVPTSPLISLLNWPGVTSEADLAVISGVARRRGPFRDLMVLAADLFFRHEHDLIVDTASMTAGIERKNGAYVSLQSGSKVNHFGYFDDQTSQERIHAWLTREDAEEVPGFEKVRSDKLSDLNISLTRSGDIGDQPLVFLIPGLMASHLKEGEDRRWLSRYVLAPGGFEMLALQDAEESKDAGESANITVDQIVAEPYQDLADRLSMTFEVFPFPYDWRKSHLHNADRLADAVHKALTELERPVYILAHSGGGLIARAMLAQHTDIWKTLTAWGGRLVMLGTPNQGSYGVLRMLAGQSLLPQMMSLLDPARKIEPIVEVMRNFPGLLELLPEAAVLDSCQEEWWQAENLQALLAIARGAQASWRSAVDARHMCYVAGAARVTPAGVKLDDEGRMSFTYTDAGDGMVTYESGGLADVPTWYTEASHGELAGCRDVVEGITDLLLYGDTDDLGQTAPDTDDTLYPLPVTEPFLPRDRDLVDAAVGGDRQPCGRERAYQLKVSVSYGSMEHARFPVAVGHYKGDVIVGAEAFLDARLNGRLSQRFNMGIYPGQVGSAELIMAPKCHPPGAMVIGLNDVGMITPEILTSGVVEACLKRAMSVLEEDNSDDEQDPVLSAAFSTVLIGIQGGRALSIESSVSAIVAGAIQANRILREMELGDKKVHIDEIQFIELYEDIAIHAAHAIRHLNRHLRIVLETDERVVPATSLQTLAGGLPRRPTSDYASGWWRRLQITEKHGKKGDSQQSGALQFLLLTDRARAELTTETTQRKLVDELVAESIRQSQTPDLPASLYELLMPNHLKDQAYETVDLMLVLDSAAARYPWEMLAERRRDGRLLPLSIRMGLVRQLTTATFRPRVTQATGYHALVIGDPELGDNDKYPSLQAAQEEAEVVGELIRKRSGKDWRVYDLIGKNATVLNIIDTLYARDYRIVHIAGHGEFAEDENGCRGVVIGNNNCLTAAEFHKLRVVPDLVFLNCCYLAKTDRADGDESKGDRQKSQRWNELAASLAEELINMGVRAVVAAGWAVDDVAAKDFATLFYERMFAGDSFGQAILTARRHVFQKHGDRSNAWGAYQCYGDPSYRLTSTRPDDRLQGKDYVAPYEVIERLELLKNRAKGADESKQTQDLDMVYHLARIVPKDWRSGRLNYSLAAAFGEMGVYAEAITYYEEAIQASSADEEVPIRAIEQLVNMKARRATELMEEGEQDSARDQQLSNQERKEAALKLLEDAERQIQSLGTIVTPTPAHLASAGTVQKRLALIHDDDEKNRIEALKQARDLLCKAHHTGLKQKGLDPYHALNWVTYRFLNDDFEHDDLERTKMIDLVNRCCRLVAESKQRDPNFWTRVGIPDAKLVLSLLQGDIAKHQDTIQKDYLSAFDLGSSGRERRTIYEHLDFLFEILQWKHSDLTVPIKCIRDAVGERIV